MLRQYETTFIVDSYLSGDQIDATIDKVKKFIENHSGKVKFIDRWGKRRLAYEIAKKQYGYYVYIRFDLEGSVIKELERGLKLDDSILRYLIVLVPKIVLKKETEHKPAATKVDDKDELKSQGVTSKSLTDKPDFVPLERTKQDDRSQTKV